MSRRAVFLDRDGVLVRDVGPLTRAADIDLMPGVVPALNLLAQSGFALIVVSNQTVLARGLLEEAEMLELEGHIEKRIRAEGGPALDGFYFCPHHPSADRPELRRDCSCRKPAPGLLLLAALEHGISLERSFVIGDRPSDVEAGLRAGCTTIQVTTGAHAAPPIEVRGGFLARPPHYTASGLPLAVAALLGHIERELGEAS